YRYFFKPGERFIVMFISRGCPYNCSYCFQATSKYRLRTIDSVIEELKVYYYKYKIRVIHFYDDTFTASRRWLLKFFKRLREENLNISWSCLARIDSLDEELIREMKRSGCFLVKLGIESGDPRILRSMNKNFKISTIYKIIDLLNKYKFIIHGFFLLGVPGETRESVKNTFRLVLNLKLDYIQVSRLIAMPKIKYYLDYLEKGGKDFWNDIYLARSRKYDYVLNDVEFTEKELNKLVRKLILRFYLRPSQVLRIKRTEKFNHFRLFKLIKSIFVIISILFKMWN
ncbi:MAG: B12-binding domain-containing radical SAM protein, partial [Promethearchaeota archaeon]